MEVCSSSCCNVSKVELLDYLKHGDSNMKDVINAVNILIKDYKERYE